MIGKFYNFFFPMAVVLFLVSSITNAQFIDESRIDRLTPDMYDGIEPLPPDSDAPITIDGYDNFNLGTDFAEPHMSENPNNPLQYFNAFNINNAHRTSDGHEWIFSAPSFGTSVAGDPVTAYDSLGNLYYINMYGGITGTKIIRSTDNGGTWSTSVTAILGGDKCWIAADQTSGPYANYVYVTMTNGAFSGHGFARSTNNGATFTTTFTATGSPLPGAMPCVGPNVLAGDIPGGCVYFITNTGSSFASTYKLYLSTDGGLNFTLKSTNNFSNYVGTDVGGRNTVRFMRTRPYPFIAADNSYGAHRGRLYLVYASNTPAGNGNKPDIFCRFSDDQGTTWSSAVVVNDDANTTLNHQWHPAIWCDKTTGRLYAQWMDTRDTPTSDSSFIYGSYSDDGGVTWAANQKISNKKTKICATGICTNNVANYMGDYNAIVSNELGAMAVWTDFRNNNYGSYTGYFPDFAMLSSPSTQNIDNINDTVFYSIDVPDVKLYTETASFTATITPTPASGSLILDFPSGNTLSTYPGSVPMRIYTSGTVTNGTYTINIQGQGPNGTPVHRRTVSIVVVDPVPVELSAFTANVKIDNVYLNWQTATELNNRGFEVERATIENTKRSDWSVVKFVPGAGTTTNPMTYQFIDTKMNAGSYVYRLKQIDFDGSFEYSYEVEAIVSSPVDYSLSQNYPNPFNPSTSISYSIPENAFVTLKIYDVLGNEVEVLINEQKESGNYQIDFNASELSSGIYYYTLTAGNFTSTKKMSLIK